VWRSPVPRLPPPRKFPATPKAVPELRPPASVQLRVSFLILIVILISPSSSRGKAEIKSKITMKIKTAS
jgi:hypothetical protein